MSIGLGAPARAVGAAMAANFFRLPVPAESIAAMTFPTGSYIRRLPLRVSTA